MIIVCVFFILLVISSSVIKSIAIACQYRLGSLISADIGNKVFTTVLYKPYEWHLKSNTSQIISLITGDVERSAGIIKGILLLSSNFVVILMVGIFLVSYSPIVMLIVFLSFALFYVSIFNVFGKIFVSEGRERSSKYRKIIKIVQESLGGIREIILGDYYGLYLSEFDINNRRRTMTDSKILTRAAIPRYLVEGFLIILISSVSLSYLLLDKSITDILPVLGTVSLGAYKLLQPVQQCFSTIGTIQSNQASLEKFYEYCLIPTL